MAMRPILTSAEFLASKAHSGERAQAAVTPLSWRVRCNVPDTNSKVTQIKFRTTPSLFSVLPGWENPMAAGCWHVGGHISHPVLALFLGSFSKYLLLATAGDVVSG